MGFWELFWRSPSPLSPAPGVYCIMTGTLSKMVYVGEIGERVIVRANIQVDVKKEVGKDRIELSLWLALQCF